MADQDGVVNPGGNTPGAGDSNAVATPPAPGGEQPVGGAPAGTTPAEKVYTFKEDRTDWTPRTRLNEESRKRQEAEARIAAIESELEKERARVRAALGIETKPKDEQDAEAIRAEILKLVKPEDIVGMTREELEELRNEARAAKATSQAQWERHAGNMIDQVAEQVAKAIGATELTPRQMRRLQSAYRDEATAAYRARQRAAQTGDTYDDRNDFLARHERGDQKLIAEFAKEFVGDWFEPAKRSAQAALQRGQRVVPRGERDRALTTTKTPEIDYNDPAAFKKAMAEARAARE